MLSVPPLALLPPTDEDPPTVTGSPVHRSGSPLPPCPELPDEPPAPPCWQVSFSHWLAGHSAEHSPSLLAPLATAQASQPPSQATPQQTPSAQKPD